MGWKEFISQGKTKDLLISVCSFKSLSLGIEEKHLHRKSN